MKTRPALLAAAVLISGVLAARAEEAAQEKQSSGLLQNFGALPPDTAPSLFPTAPAATAPIADPTPLPTPSPTPEAADGDKKGNAERLREAVRIRELKTAAGADPRVCEELTKANQAKTAEGRRILMRNYYLLLYTKMEKLDPSLTVPLERELYDNLRRFEQRGIRPSVLIEDVTPLPGSCSADHLPPGVTPDATPKPVRSKQKRF